MNALVPVGGAFSAKTLFRKKSGRMEKFKMTGLISHLEIMDGIPGKDNPRWIAQ